MAMIYVRHRDGSAAQGAKVAISFNGGGMKDSRTDRDGKVVISGSSTYGKIFVNGTERHNGSLSGTFEFEYSNQTLIPHHLAVAPTSLAIRQ